MQIDKSTQNCILTLIVAAAGILAGYQIFKYYNEKNKLAMRQLARRNFNNQLTEIESRLSSLDAKIDAILLKQQAAPVQPQAAPKRNVVSMKSIKQQQAMKFLRAEDFGMLS